MTYKKNLIFISHSSPPSTSHMIHVQVDDSKVFLLARLPLPPLATADSSKPAYIGFYLQNMQQGEQWRVAMTKTCPDNAECVIWALDE